MIKISTHSILGEVLALIQETLSLSEWKKGHLTEVAKTLDEAKLEKLRQIILKIQAEETEAMKAQCAVLKTAGVFFAECKTRKARDQVHQAEAIASKEDLAFAENLISQLQI